MGHWFGGISPSAKPLEPSALLALRSVPLIELYVRAPQRAVGNDGGGLSRPTACANTQALPTDGANCKDSICNDPK